MVKPSSSDRPPSDVGEWFLAHKAFLWQIALQRLSSTEDADDVVQETFVTAFERSRKSQEEFVDARSFLLRILTNKIGDRYRSRRRRQIAIPTVTMEDNTCINAGLAQSQARLFEQCCQQLDGAQIRKTVEPAMTKRRATAFDLSINGYTRAEIAEMMGITPTAANNLIFKATTTYRAEWQRYESWDDGTTSLGSEVRRSLFGVMECGQGPPTKHEPGANHGAIRHRLMGAVAERIKNGARFELFRFVDPALLDAPAASNVIAMLRHNVASGIDVRLCVTQPNEPLIGLDLLGDDDDRVMVLGHHYGTREFLGAYGEVQQYTTFDPTIFYHWAPMFVRKKERPDLFKKLFNCLIDVRSNWLFNRNRDVFFVDSNEVIREVEMHLDHLLNASDF